MATMTRSLRGQADSSNQVFYTPDLFMAGTLVLYLNGIRQAADGYYPYQEMGPNAFQTLGWAPLEDDDISVQYEIETSGDDTVVVDYPMVTATGIKPRT